MIDNLKLLLYSATLKDSIIMLIGGGLATFFGFLLTVILTRNLDPASFGLFITSLTFIQVVTDFSEMGINASVFNFVASTKNRERLSFVKNTFIIKLFLASIISITVFMFSTVIADLVFKNQNISSFIRYSAIGIFLQIIITWGQTVLQAQKKFFAYSLNNLSMNLFRLLILVLLFSLGMRNALHLFLALQLVLFLTLALLLHVTNLNFLKLPIDLVKIRRIVKFGLPVGIGFSLWAVYTKLDQILILNIRGAEEAGTYGVAFRIAMMIIFAASIFGTAITPRFATLSRKAFYPYFKKSLIASLILGSTSLLLIILAPIFLPLLFGTIFISSILPFQILVLGSTIFIFALPFNYAILYQFKNSNFMMWSSLLYLILLWFLLKSLVPLWGSIGAAVSMLVMYTIQLVLSIGYFFYLSNFKLSNEEAIV